MHYPLAHLVNFTRKQAQRREETCSDHTAGWGGVGTLIPAPFLDLRDSISESIHPSPGPYLASSPSAGSKLLLAYLQ